MAVQFAVGGAFLPFVTLFLRDRGLSYQEIGWVNVLSAMMSATVPFFWGWVADRWVAVDRLLVLLHFGGAVALVALGRQHSLTGILVSNAILFALYPPTTPLLSALAYHHFSSPDRQFSRLRLWGSIGWILPSLPISLWIAGLASNPGDAAGGAAGRIDFAFTFDVAAGIELALALLALLLPRTPPVARGGPASDHSKTAGDFSYGAALRRLLARRGFLRVLAAVVLLQAAFAILFYYSPPFIEQAGFAREWLAPIQAIGVVCEIPLFLTLAWVVRRFGYRGTLIIGSLSLLLRHVLFAASAPGWVLLASYVLAGMSVVYYLTAASLTVNALAERPVRATAQTILTLAGPGIGQVLGHLAAGTIAERSGAGLQGAFAFAAAASLAGLFILLLGGAWEDVGGTVPANEKNF